MPEKSYDRIRYDGHKSKRKCPTCEKIFIGKTKYCCNQCFRKGQSIARIGEGNGMFGKIPYNKDKKAPIELRKKLSEAHKGKTYLILHGEDKSKEIRNKISESNKGQVPWIKGKHHDEKTKHVISEKLQGEKSHFWKGGISFEPCPVSFNRRTKELIRIRDKYLCQNCGISQLESGRKLYVHHIDYQKKNLNPTNLISLCIHCHVQTNSNRVYWTDKLKHKISCIYNEKLGMTIYEMLDKGKFNLELLESPKDE